MAKFSYFFSSHLFTFHFLVQLLLPMVKLNRVDEPISIEYKMVHVSPLYANTIKCSSNSSMQVNHLSTIHFSSYFAVLIYHLKGFQSIIEGPIARYADTRQQLSSFMFVAAKRIKRTILKLRSVKVNSFHR